MSSARIREKIAALRAKTSAAGCTEAEALAAAELAARLMREHGLSEADMVMGEASAPERTTKATWRTKLSAAIGICTNTAGILLVDPDGGNTMLFVGREPGPEIALYLRDVCTRAVTEEQRRFKAGEFYRRRRTAKTKRQASADFVEGLVERLVRRLFELFRPTIDPEAREEARAVLDRRFAKAVAMRLPERKTRYSHAAAMGWIAGGDVALNHGVGDAPAPLRIGDAR